MALFGATIEAGITAVKKLLDKLLLKDDDFLRISESVAQQILQNNLDRFLNEEGPDGPWEESERGKKRKAGGYTRSSRDGNYYTGTGTLYETGTLFHSIGVNVEPDGTIDLFFTDKIGEYHDPTRTIIGFSDEDVDLVNNAIIRYLN